MQQNLKINRIEYDKSINGRLPYIAIEYVPELLDDSKVLLKSDNIEIRIRVLSNNFEKLFAKKLIESENDILEGINLDSKMEITIFNTDVRIVDFEIDEDVVPTIRKLIKKLLEQK